MTQSPALLDGPLRWAAFALLATAAALAVVRATRGRAASVRHGACFLGLLGALAFPLVALIVPRIDVVVAETVVAPAMGAAGESIGAAAPSAAGGPWWVVGILWTAVSAVLLTRVVVSSVRVGRLAARAVPLDSPIVRSEARRAARSVGLDVVPRVVTHAAVPSPSAWGVTRSVVFLPSDAARWRRGRLRAVLLHECAHLVRRDPLTQLVADAACAAFWFVPFAWACAARMRREREVACDDLVVAGGARPSAYARFLLRMSCSDRTAPAVVAALGERSQLETRVRALVAPATPRPPASRDERAWALAAVLIAVALSASSRPVIRVVPGADATAAHVVPRAEQTARSAGAESPERLAVSAPVEPSSETATLRTPGPPASGPTAETGVGEPPVASAPAMDAPLSTPDDVPSLAALTAAEPSRTDAGERRGTVRALRRLEDAFDSEGRFLGGALHIDPCRGVVVDDEALKAFLGLPADTPLATVVRPVVVRRVQRGRR